MPIPPSAPLGGCQGIRMFRTIARYLVLAHFFLQEDVDNSLVENGVLTVSVPKSTPELVPKTIAINELLFDRESPMNDFPSTCMRG
jgi:hypothetical protein